MKLTDAPKAILPPLTLTEKLLLFSVSLFLVAFGQPAWSWINGLIASVIGYALFWRILFDYTSAKKRFWLSVAWFGLVQLIQLSWLISHPYNYIYALWLLLPFLWGLQFGIIGLFIQPATFQKWHKMLLIPALWILMEWLRLFILSGFPFNPSGIALTSSIYPMQMASLAGVFGLSFWVMFTNCLALKSWISRWSVAPFLLLALAVATPYFYGYYQITTHAPSLAEEEAKNAPYHALLVQTAFPVEETMNITSKQAFIQYVFDEWVQILQITKKHQGKPIDLIAYPEFVVPLATFTPLYPLEKVKEAFKDALGESSLKKLPALDAPFAQKIGSGWFVNNAFWLQGIANSFDADVVAGVEDVDDVEGQRHFYSSAMYFRANRENHPDNLIRYEKQVLVPMGEYIPFSFLQKLASDYGIAGSFTCGTGAKLFGNNRIPFGVSICYEEAYGHMMKENKTVGAKMLVNLTSDIWYPNSKLVQQHFDHSRLRTVEMGIPLIRSCNTGLTCGVDSLGRMIAVLGNTPEEQEWSKDALYLRVPTYTYPTIYSRFGDWLILAVAACCLLLNFVLKLKD